CSAEAAYAFVADGVPVRAIISTIDGAGIHANGPHDGALRVLAHRRLRSPRGERAALAPGKPPRLYAVLELGPQLFHRGPAHRLERRFDIVGARRRGEHAQGKLGPQHDAHANALRTHWHVLHPQFAFLAIGSIAARWHSTWAHSFLLGESHAGLR